MNKSELHNLVLEVFNEYVKEAELKTGDNIFNIKVDVNKNPTKKGLKIQLLPKGDTILLEPDEKIKVTEKVQSLLNTKLNKFNLQVNIDPDIEQATDNPNVLGYYIPIDQFRNLIIDALKES